MKKKTPYSDRIEFSKNNKTTNRNEYNSKINKKSGIEKDSGIDGIDNPFNKVIDRHYGSFKCRILGNYKNVFNSLTINSIKPFGRYGTIQRKVLKTKAFTAVFYSSGSVELKIARASLSGKRAIESLRAEFFQAARKAQALLEKCYSLTLTIPVQNRPAKYGVEDSAARAVNLEIEGRKRKMDASTRIIKGRVVRRVSHVDNFGSLAARADSRLSEKEHDLISSEIAKSKGFKDEKSFEFRKAKGIARLQAPELLISIENKLEAVFETNSQFKENIDLHLKVEQAQLENMVLSNKLLKGMQGTKHRFPTTFKKSATVQGCN